MTMRQLLNRILPVVVLAAVPAVAWAADKAVAAVCHGCCPRCWF